MTEQAKKGLNVVFLESGQQYAPLHGGRYAEFLKAFPLGQYAILVDDEPLVPFGEDMKPVFKAKAKLVRIEDDKIIAQDAAIATVTTASEYASLLTAARQRVVAAAGFSSQEILAEEKAAAQAGVVHEKIVPDGDCEEQKPPTKPKVEKLAPKGDKKPTKAMLGLVAQRAGKVNLEVDKLKVPATQNQAKALADKLKEIYDLIASGANPEETIEESGVLA